MQLLEQHSISLRIYQNTKIEKKFSLQFSALSLEFKYIFIHCSVPDGVRPAVLDLCTRDVMKFFFFHFSIFCFHW